MDVLSRQRAALVSLLDSLSDAQWSAETLCAGWDAGDVAAHLIVREREPIAALGLVLPPLRGLLERRTAARRDRGREVLLAQLRNGPSWIMRLPLTRDAQVVEDWIHTADIARGGAATADGPVLPTTDGTEDPQVARLLWGALNRFAPLTLRSIDRGGAIAFTDGITTTRTFRVGGRIARPAPDAQPDVTVTGPVGDLVLYVTGREAARVDITGDTGLVRELRSAGRGV